MDANCRLKKHSLKRSHCLVLPGVKRTLSDFAENTLQRLKLHKRKWHVQKLSHWQWRRSCFATYPAFSSLRKKTNPGKITKTGCWVVGFLFFFLPLGPKDHLFKFKDHIFKSTTPSVTSSTGIQRKNDCNIFQLTPLSKWSKMNWNNMNYYKFLLKIQTVWQQSRSVL